MASLGRLCVDTLNECRGLQARRIAPRCRPARCLPGSPASLAMIRARDPEILECVAESWGPLPRPLPRGEDDVPGMAPSRPIRTKVVELVDFHEHYRAFGRLLTAARKRSQLVHVLLMWFAHGSLPRVRAKLLRQLEST